MNPDGLIFTKTEFEKLRIMASGVKAALLARGGVLAWGAGQIWEQFHKK